MVNLFCGGLIIRKSFVKTAAGLLVFHHSQLLFAKYPAHEHVKSLTLSRNIATVSGCDENR
jgi:hypothetical protein